MLIIREKVYKSILCFFSMKISISHIIFHFWKPTTGGTFYRGCLKEESEGRYMCEQDAARCEVCDENACNSQMKWEMNAGNRQSARFIHFSIITFMVWYYSMWKH